MRCAAFTTNVVKGCTKYKDEFHPSLEYTASVVPPTGQKIKCFISKVVLFFPEEQCVMFQGLFWGCFFSAPWQRWHGSPFQLSSPAAADHSSPCVQATRSASFPSASSAPSRRKTWTGEHLPSNGDFCARFQSFT